MLPRLRSPSSLLKNYSSLVVLNTVTLRKYSVVGYHLRPLMTLCSTPSLKIRSELVNWRLPNNGAPTLARKVLTLKDSGVTRTAYATGESWRSPSSESVPNATTVSGKTPRRSAVFTASLFSSMMKIPLFLPPGSRPPSTNVSRLMLSSSITTMLRTCPSTRSLRWTTTRLAASSPWLRTQRVYVENRPLIQPPFLTKSTSTSLRLWTKSSSTSIWALRETTWSLVSSKYLRPPPRRPPLTSAWSLSLLTTSLSNSLSTAARHFKSRTKWSVLSRKSARNVMKLPWRTYSTLTWPKPWRWMNLTRSRPLASPRRATSSRRLGLTRSKRSSSLASLLKQDKPPPPVPVLPLLGSTSKRTTKRLTNRENWRNS